LSFSNIVKEISRFSKKGDILLTFVSKCYEPIFDLWLKYITQFGTSGLCVIALDEEIYTILQDKEIPSVLMNVGKNITHETKGSLWLQRVRLFRGLVDHDINIIHSDADAFWFKDMRKVLEDYDSDLVFSMAFGMPKSIVNEWGFVLCCGFFKINSNEKTKAFMRDFEKICGELLDDQVAINTLLKNQDVSWQRKNSKYYQGYCDKYNLSIDMLPENIVSRHPADELGVYHPYLYSQFVNFKYKQALDGLYRCSSYSAFSLRDCACLHLKKHKIKCTAKLLYKKVTS